ncbi:hypothetical protein [Kocuria palustris]|uniref:hypothetical protein n=1 Tax=Kocuria palustris TaxID=71999 RepID=UPI0006AA1D00|nr:hypothetical protein [Kocuria palustris]ALB03254.1 hypothetical protein KPaMU14_06670 [Kocuria palustris]
MTPLNRASIDVVMRVDDPAGRPIEIDRDVVRRSYMALKAMARTLYAHHRPPERFPEEGLSMSFYEPGPGAVVFEAQVVADVRGRAGDQPTPLGAGNPGPVRTAEQALRLSVLGLVEIVRAFGFVLAAPQTVREVRCGHVGLTEADGGQHLRVSPEVDYGLLHGSFDAQMREFLSGLTREGVGAVSLAHGAEDKRSRIQHMVIATDRVLEFVRGAQVQRPIDRRSTDPDPDPEPGAGLDADAKPGAA